MIFKKEKILLSVALVASILTATFPKSQHVSALSDSAAIAKMGSAIIDGDLSDWTNDTEFKISKKIGDNTRSDLNGWFKVKTDGEYLYLAAEITDAQRSAAGDDDLQIYFNFGGTDTGKIGTNANRKDGGITSVSMNGWTASPGFTDAPSYMTMPDKWGGSGWKIWGQNPNGLDAEGNALTTRIFKSSYNDTTHKYTIELSLYPSDDFKDKLKADTDFGLDVRYASQRKDVIGWECENLEWGADLSKMGLVRFENEVIETKSLEVTEGSVMVNGDLSDWAETEPIPLSSMGDSSESAGWYKVKWDDGGIYLAAQITDSTYAVSGNADLFQVYLDLDGQATGDEVVNFSNTANRKGAIYTFTQGDGGWAPGPTGTSAPIPWEGKSGSMLAAEVGNNILNTENGSGEYKVVYADGKYSIEAKLSVAPSYANKLKSGSELGFDVRYVNNEDNKATYCWSSTKDPWYNDLRRMGKISLKYATGQTSEYKTTAYKGLQMKVNGRADDWEDAEQHDISKLLSLTGASSTITDAKYMVKWDNDALYIALVLKDPVENTGRDELDVTGATIANYGSDSVRFIIDFNGKASGSTAVPLSQRENAGVYFFTTAGWVSGASAFPDNFNGMQLNDVATCGHQVLGNGNDSTEVISKYNDGEYFIESKWYFSDEIKATLEEGSELGFDIQYIDAFDQEKRPLGNENIGWASSASWQTDMRKLGTITLASTKNGETSILPQVATTDKTATFPDIYEDAAMVEWGQLNNATTYMMNIFTVASDGSYIYQTCLDQLSGPSEYVGELTPNTTYLIQMIAFNQNDQKIAVYTPATFTTTAAVDYNFESTYSNDSLDSIPQTGVAFPKSIEVILLLLSAAFVFLIRKKIITK